MSDQTDERIDDAERLWRRVHRDYYVERDDGSGWRVSPGAFRTSDPELSLDRTRVVESLGRGVEFTAQGQAGVAQVHAGDFRAEDLEPEPDPLPPGPYAPEGNPAHVLVRTRLSKGQARRLSEKCVFFAAT